MGMGEGQEEVTLQDEQAASRPAVVVYVDQVDGGFQVNYDLVGDIDPLSVPTLLEVAVTVARQHLGLRPHG